MSDRSLDALARAEIVESGVARAAALGFAVRKSSGWSAAVGAAGDVNGSRANPETVFDLASVTKPFVALAWARLVEQGRLRCDTELADLLRECEKTESARSSLELLLSHRAGLEAHLPLYAALEARRPLDRRAMIHRAARARRHDARPISGASGFEPVYSDLGYLLAGEALARAAGMPLDALVWREVSSPLAIGARSARQWLEAKEDFLDRVAPTEHVAFRGGELRGVVHDENAWAFAGHGLSGQAGLFATVNDLLRLGMALLDALSGRSGNWLDAGAVQRLVTERPGGSLRLGFDGKSGPVPSAGPSASSRSFGHLGFTGTSLWCDPAAEAVTLLLTNRVCPSRANTGIRAARPRVHEALFRLAQARS